MNTTMPACTHAVTIMLTMALVLCMAATAKAQEGICVATETLSESYRSDTDPICIAMRTFHRGEAAARVKNWHAAIKEYRRTVELDPKFVKARISLADALTELGQLDQAVVVLTVAVFTAPDYYDAVYRRGRTCLRMENYRQALRDMDSALRLVPDSADAHYWRGWTLLKLGKVREAFKDFDTAHRIDSRFPKPTLENDNPAPPPARSV